jgi:hypothetical protein
MFLAEHHQIALPVAKLSALSNAFRPMGQALVIKDVAALMPSISSWSATSAVFAQVTVELLSSLHVVLQ